MTKEISESKKWLKELNKGIKYTFLRESIARSWFADYDSLSPKEVLAKLKARKERLQEEIAYTEASSEYDSIINGLLEKETLTIYCFGDYVNQDKKLAFISPLLLQNINNSQELKQLNSKLNSVERLHCQIKDRRPEKWSVYYSGVFIDQNQETIASFNDVNNGFAVRLG